MGQTESNQHSSMHVTGFDPQLETTDKRHPRRADRDTPLGEESGAHIEEDAFLKFADVSDTISPIYEAVHQTKNEQWGVYNEIVNDVNFTQLLNDFGINEKDNASNNSNNSNDMHGFDSDEATNQTSFETNSTDDEGNRGIFHHEQKNKEDESATVTSSSVHPIFIQGDLSIGQRLKVRDGSPWAKQYPIYEVAWFIGIERGTQVLFNTVPDVTATSFTLPNMSVGRYVQVVAKRVVEDQCLDTYVADDETGIYDPHLGTMRALRTGTEKNSIIVTSAAVAGPVLISDEWAYTIVKMLSQRKFSCSIQLIQGMSKNHPSHVSTPPYSTSSNALQSIKGVLIITFSHLKLECEVSQEADIGTQSNSTNWVAWILDFLQGTSSKDSLVVEDGNTTNLLKMRFKHRKILDTIIRIQHKDHHGKIRLLAQKRKRFLDISVDSSLGRDVVLYIVIAFQAASYFEKTKSEIWSNVFSNGEFDKVKDLIERYIEETSTTVET